jgi:hypothetical protein
MAVYRLTIEPAQLLDGIYTPTPIWEQCLKVEQLLRSTCQSVSSVCRWVWLSVLSVCLSVRPCVRPSLGFRKCMSTSTVLSVQCAEDARQTMCTINLS